MVDVVYTHTINEGLGDDLLLRLIALVEAVPDSIFYGKGALVRDTDSAFNKRLQDELQKALGDTLQIVATIALDDLYSYRIEGSMALFKTPDSQWYCCLFVPYISSELLLFDEKMPRRYIVEEISARIGHYLKSADIDNCFIIGYRDPREPKRPKAEHT